MGEKSSVQIDAESAARLGSSSAAPDEVEDGTNQILRNNSMSMHDRISQLPKHILHHILCFLSQEKAVQTSVLSKSWRYLGSTRPKVEFNRCCLLIENRKETHPSVMDKILQRYHDQKLSIQHFIVAMYNFFDSETISVLEKWVPIVVTNMGAKKFYLNLPPEFYRNLYMSRNSDPLLPYQSLVLPSAVFQAEFLEELYLCGCVLSRIESTEKLQWKRLQKLSLVEVYIDDETFEKVMSSCPLIQYLVLACCMGLRTIRVNNNNLKHFEFRTDSWTTRDRSIEIGHIPSLETIRVDGYPNWFDHFRLCFTHLKSLWLTNVRLSWFDHFRLCFTHLKSLCLTYVCLSTTKSIFDNFSSNFPGLEDLTHDGCYEFQEFKLSSRSIKRLDIANPGELIKATIDTPNILYVKYLSDSLQPSISFTATCSHEWESCIHLNEFIEDVDNNDDHDGSSSWLHKINEVVKAFSQSKISVHLSQFKIPNLEKVLLDNSTYTELVVVEKLSLGSGYSSLSLPALTMCMLRIFRPRYIVLHWLYYDEAKHHESLSKILVAERGRGTHFWPQDLEDVIMEDIDLAKEKYKPVKIGFRLKWKETKMS